jgi:DNA helicase-2/ATP-dependent DNA helicase PcrA
VLFGIGHKEILIDPTCDNRGVKTAFDEALGDLNAQQRQAVETIDGPLLVIAGPGTGKTQLLSTRVGYILKNTDTAPQNILCLTFTNKATINMKERIIKLVGAEGTRANVKTFHSFASEIMNTYPDYFWNAAKLSVAPESVQLDTIEQIVKQLPLDNPLALKFAGQYTLLSDIQKSINLVKDAGLTPQKLASLIKVNLAYIDVIEEQMVDICAERLSAKKLDDLVAKVEKLPTQDINKTVYPLTSYSSVIIESLGRAVEQDGETGKTMNTGAWKKRWVQTEVGVKGMHEQRRRNLWWLELAEVYESYRGAMHQRGFYDYADMLVETISQLEKTPAMLADLQERFSYVMIDEFQDTNPAQLRLAHLVADHHSANGKPNLMVVGDDDQSIYKFNGADLNNMLGFRRSYPSAKIIILTDNYRSSQAVLDSAKLVIEQAQTRLITSDPSLSKNLLAKNPPKQAGRVRAVSYASRELQLSEIARDIKSNYKANVTIAVLARGHDSLRRMASLLQTLKVPVRYEQAGNILDHEIINQVWCWRYLPPYRMAIIDSPAPYWLRFLKLQCGG